MRVMACDSLLGKYLVHDFPIMVYNGLTIYGVLWAHLKLNGHSRLSSLVT